MGGGKLKNLHHLRHFAWLDAFVWLDRFVRELSWQPHQIGMDNCKY